MSVRTRVAPSPTGFPHVGTIYQSIFDYVWAKKHGGQFLVRLEDTDRARYVNGAAEQILAMIRWSGIPYDEGPDIGGPVGPYIQSERLDLYQETSQSLIDAGQAYYCFCTPERLAQMRVEQEKQHLPPKYDRHCLGLSKEEVVERINGDEKFVIRLKVPEGTTSFTDLVMGEITFQNAEIDDQVLLKSDGFPTYHLAVVVDDHAMKITSVIRGTEWISSTPKHILLYQYLGWDLPTFTHIPLLLNADKSKLSKRKNDVSILSYKEQGYLPEALVNFLSQLGWSHPEGKDIYSLEEMIELFSWQRVPKTGSVFSFDKMRWYNGQYIRKLAADDLVSRLTEYSRHPEIEIARVVPLIHDRLVLLSEFDDLVAFLYEDPEYEQSLLIGKNQSAESTKAALVRVQEALVALPQPWNHADWEAQMRAIANDLGWKAGDLFMTLRVAMTGSTQSPPLFESMELLGVATCLARVTIAIEQLD
jgi:glutamyl-tRNA synthetase